MPRGGARPGAGRPKKDRTPDGQIFEDAESYLTAVVQGHVAADPARIQAAKCLIAYQRARSRAPVKSLPPEELARKAQRSVEAATVAAFEEKEREIRAKFAARRSADDGCERKADAGRV